VLNFGGGNFFATGMMILRGTSGLGGCSGTFALGKCGGRIQSLSQRISNNLMALFLDRNATTFFMDRAHDSAFARSITSVLPLLPTMIETIST
jgi:hypothetical protein